MSNRTISRTRNVVDRLLHSDQLPVKSKKEPQDGFNQPRQQNGHPVESAVKPTNCGVAVIGVGIVWIPKENKSIPPLMCNHLNFELACEFVTLINSVPRPQFEWRWAVVVRQTRKCFGVSAIHCRPEDRPIELLGLPESIQQTGLTYGDACESARAINDSIMTLAKHPKRWAIVVQDASNTSIATH